MNFLYKFHISKGVTTFRRALNAHVAEGDFKSNYSSPTFSTLCKEELAQLKENTGDGRTLPPSPQMPLLSSLLYIHHHGCLREPHNRCNNDWKQRLDSQKYHRLWAKSFRRQRDVKTWKNKSSLEQITSRQELGKPQREVFSPINNEHLHQNRGVRQLARIDNKT